MINKVVSGIVVFLAGSFGVVSAEEIKVSVGGSFETVQAFRDRDIQYISLSELANSLGGAVAWDIVGHTVSYADTGFKFEFLIGAPWVNVNDTTYNLTHEAVYRDGQLYVPMATFLPLLDRVTSQHIAWEPGEETVRVESEYFNVTDLSVQSKANGLLIEIYLTAPLAYQIFITEGNWLNVSLREASINRNRCYRGAMLAICMT